MMDTAPTPLPPGQTQLIRILDHICRYREFPFPAGEDPWPLFEGKLLDLDPPIRTIKQAQLNFTQQTFAYQLSRNQLTEHLVSEFKTSLGWNISPGDFEDVSLLLDFKKLSDPSRRRSITAMLAELKPFSLFDEEKKPARVRFRTPETKIQEMAAALNLPLFENIMVHRKLNLFRRRFILRRLRRSIDRFRTGIRPPIATTAPISPLATNQIEAMTVAVLRFLAKFPAETEPPAA